MRTYFRDYLKNRPIFLSLIRGKEALLYQKYLPLKKPVLDYGCGDGIFVKLAIKNKQGKIEVGVDINKEVIKSAKKSKMYKSVYLLENNRLPFKNSSFGSLISNCVLEHVDKLEPNLKELNRVLKRGGLFVCTVMTDKWEGYLLGTKFLGDYYKTWMRKKQVHVQLPSYGKWKRIFNTVGFEVVESIGYLDGRASRWLDALHYISFYSLVTMKLTGEWVKFPFLFDIFPVDRFLEKLAHKNVSPAQASAVFFVLKKK